MEPGNRDFGFTVKPPARTGSAESTRMRSFDAARIGTLLSRMAEITMRTWDSAISAVILLAMRTIEVPDFIAVTTGIVVFFLGAFLTRHISFLRNYNIPEPVSGGLAAALVIWFVYGVMQVEVTFSMETRNLLLVIFFTTIGLNARFQDLVVGGRMLGILLVLTIGYMFFQNGVALLGTRIFGLPTEIGPLLGSASLIGGHGTAIAWGPTIEEQSGFEAAAEIGIAAATLGLVFAALIGGPIAKFLIDRNNLIPALPDDTPEGLVGGLPYENNLRGGHHAEQTIDHVNIMRSMLAINVAIILGYIANLGIAKMGLKLPLFVPCLLVGIVMSNTIPLLFKGLPWPSRTRALAVISDYSLSIFLAMSLMSMQLWSLAELGGPLFVILGLQVIATVAFILFIVFKAMGKSYTAAVLSAGFAGFSLGATPTAIANMSSVTKRYGPAPLAFILLPLVSAFFVDLANAFIIRFFVSL